MGKEVETLKEKHNVFVLSFINDEKEQKIAQEEYDKTNSLFIKSTSFTKAVNAIMHPWRPLFFSIRSSYAFKKRLKEIIEKKSIDAVHAEFTSMGQFIWIKKKFPNISFTLVEHDVTKQSYDRQVEDTKGVKRLFYRVQAYLVKRCEEKYCNLADHVLTLNEKDKRLVENYYNLKKVEVMVPFYGLDFNKVEKKTEKMKNSICFIGNMSRKENDLAAKKLIDICSKLSNQEFNLTIIGAYPSDELLKMESDKVHITGFVDVIEDEILKHEIAVFPLTLGAGIKLKVLLACGLGLPVVTSHVGAEGIDEEGEVLFLAEADDEFLKSIELLINDPDLRKEKAIQSKKFILTKFSWDKTKKIFNSIYN
nr:glycosyltransferase family 4 protein [Faecalicoccus pleomorphus]